MIYNGNIGPRGITRRRRLGWLMLVIAIGGSGYTFIKPSSPVYDVILLFAFFTGFLGVLQAREKT